MTQYLLSAHSVEGEVRAPMTEEQMRQTYTEVMALETEMKSAGAWLFGGRLHEADTATVVRMSNGSVLTTDGPFVEAKEHLGGFYIIEADDLDAALSWASKVTAIVRRADRGSPVREGTRSLSHVPGELDENVVGQIFREESGRSVATLIRVFGDIDLAEDAVQEAFATALRKWPADGLPPNPGGWITTTARNHAIDRLRRETRGRELLGETTTLTPEVSVLPQRQQGWKTTGFASSSPAATRPCPRRTDRAHPPPARRLSVEEIARSFLVSAPALKQRLARAKRKIKAAGSLPRTGKPRAARPATAGAGRHLPALQRRSRRTRPVPGGDPPGEDADRVHARRT